VVSPSIRTGRTLAWFSAGAASAVATKLALAAGDNVVIARIDTGSEHPDNERFAADCEEWFGQTIEVHRSPDYVDTWDVWKRTRYLVGPGGARCTVELKKKVRFAIEQPDDTQVFGYTVEERKRANRFRDQNPEINLWTPLIDAGLTKADCLAMIDRAGIEIPVMYRLGYHNNNCIACPKATAPSYWARIHRDFRESFDRMAAVERELGVSIMREDARQHDNPRKLWLDELDVTAVDMGADEPDFECSLMCHLAEAGNNQ
jgi:3'-phosphoadenosine 5'-phosphosulfate sulfotransferase (PAPS reductase)/FAD synthetase